MVQDSLELDLNLTSIKDKYQHPLKADAFVDVSVLI